MSQACSGTFKVTMGLSCAHMMSRWKGQVLPIERIHSQWRIDIRGSLFSEDEYKGESGLNGMFTKLQNNYQQLPLTEKEYIIDKLCGFFMNKYL